jgi:hypothetical protein
MYRLRLKPSKRNSMPKLSVPLTAPQHRALKIRAAEVGLTQAEVARRLLMAWVELECAPEDMEEAVRLWRVWLKEKGDPYDILEGCFFCYEEYPHHRDGCIYLSVEASFGDSKVEHWNEEERSEYLDRVMEEVPSDG